MATRAIYYFTDTHSSYRVYVHWDNTPACAYEFIKAALKYAWKLPRFEADEFAAAFIKANKDEEGGVRLIPSEVTDMGQDYNYFITMRDDDIYIEFIDTNEDDEEILFSGNLNDMKKYIEENE